MSEAELVRPKVRAAVYERDNGCCRVCGRHCGDTPGLHHIDYRSEGGTNDEDNLITIGWTPGHDCHLPIVHHNKRLWKPILKVVVATDGVTAFQVRRWALAMKQGKPGAEVAPSVRT